MTEITAPRYARCTRCEQQFDLTQSLGRLALSIHFPCDEVNSYIPESEIDPSEP